MGQENKIEMLSWNDFCDLISLPRSEITIVRPLNGQMDTAVFWFKGSDEVVIRTRYSEFHLQKEQNHNFIIDNDFIYGATSIAGSRPWIIISEKKIVNKVTQKNYKKKLEKQP